MPTLVIIGAGFSGAACACQFLARCADGWQVRLVNASGPVARGLAYGTRSPLHLLNVPAGRLGIDPDAEHDFARYLADTGRPYHGGDFVPRMIYGEYLEVRLREAAEARGGSVAIHIGRVERMDRRDGGGFRLGLAGSGATLDADAVILAMGHLSPVAPLASLHDLGERYIHDPWAPGAMERIGRDERVLILGSGLTMLDLVVDLARRDHRGQLTALSRRGLLPQPHRHHDAPPPVLDLDPAQLLQARSTRALTRRVREALHRAAAAGTDWRDVIGALRPVTAALWQSLDDTEKRRFMRHVRPYWEVARHRTAPAPFAALQALHDAGRLEVRAGRLRDVSGSNEHILARWNEAREGAREASFDRVVNCTGPGMRIDACSAPLLHGLLVQGLLSQDTLRLGLNVDPHGRALDAQGLPVDGLYYVGPLLRAQFWEATAVPELRQHAARAVGHLLSASGTPAP